MAADVLSEAGVGVDVYEASFDARWINPLWQTPLDARRKAITAFSCSPRSE